MNESFENAWNEYVNVNLQLKNDKKAKEDFEAGWSAALSFSENLVSSWNGAQSVEIDYCI